MSNWSWDEYDGNIICFDKLFFHARKHNLTAQIVWFEPKLHDLNQICMIFSIATIENDSER